MCVGAGGRGRAENADACGLEMFWIPWSWSYFRELQGVVKPLTWVLGTELLSSARAVHVLNH